MLNSLLALAALAATPAVPMQDEAPPPVYDGRGWTIQCAVVAKYLRDDEAVRLSDARIDNNPTAMARAQAEVDRLDAVYNAALAAPSDVADMTERFALARRFRDEVYGMQDGAREDVIASCELVLGVPAAD